MNVTTPPHRFNCHLARIDYLAVDDITQASTTFIAQTKSGLEVATLRRGPDAPEPIFAPDLLSVHTRSMRANVNLDPDAYTFASTYASARGLPLGAAISQLLRRAEQAQEPPSPLLITNSRGMLVVAKTGHTVTPEMVKELSEDDLV